MRDKGYKEETSRGLPMLKRSWIWTVNQQNILMTLLE